MSLIFHTNISHRIDMLLSSPFFCVCISNTLTHYQRAATAATSLELGWLEAWRERRGQLFRWLLSPPSPSSVCWCWWASSSTGGTHTHKHTHTQFLCSHLHCTETLICLCHRNCFQAANFYPDDTASPKVISVPSTPMLLATGNTHTHSLEYVTSVISSS